MKLTTKISLVAGPPDSSSFSSCLAFFAYLFFNRSTNSASQYLKYLKKNLVFITLSIVASLNMGITIHLDGHKLPINILCSGSILALEHMLNNIKFSSQCNKKICICHFKYDTVYRTAICFSLKQPIPCYYIRILQNIHTLYTIIYRSIAVEIKINNIHCSENVNINAH